MCRADVEPMTPRQRGHIMALCSRAELGQDERREFAEYLIGRRSLSGASKAEAARLIDALTGYVEIHALLALRPPGAGPKAPTPSPDCEPVYAVDPDGRRWLVRYRRPDLP